MQRVNFLHTIVFVISLVLMFSAAQPGRAQEADLPHHPNIIWLASLGDGLTAFDIRTKTWTTYKNNPDDADTIGELSGFSQDKSDPNTRWMGSWGGGFCRFDIAGKTFSTPFWKTWWFYALCCLIAAGVIGGIYSARANQLRLRAEKAELETEKARVEANNARMEAELDVARRLQQLLLPTEAELDAIESLDIAGAMLPAEEVGGDYYDMLKYETGQITFTIGDVTGHGLESGIIMLMLQTAMRVLHICGENSPQHMINVLNRTLYESLQRMRIEKNTTMAVLNYSLGQMELKIGGQHEHIIIMRRDGRTEVIDTLDLGFPLGLQSNIESLVHEQSIHLQSSDGVVLYTDGVTEAQNADGDFYEIERLCSMLQQHWTQPAKEIRDIVIKDVRAFIGDQTQYDDIALVIVKQH